METADDSQGPAARSAARSGGAVRGAPLVLAIVATMVPGRASADVGGEVGAVALGESGGEGGRGVGALRLAGNVDLGRGTADELATGIDGQLATGELGPLRGTHWLRYRQDVALRRAQATGKPAGIESWLVLEHRLDYEARASLMRRRDLVRGRHTGEFVALEAVLLGASDPRKGGAFMPFRWDLAYVDGGDVLHRFRAAFGRWWTDADGDGEPHVREVISIDSYVHDREAPGIANTIVFYAERGRPLSRWGLLADFRIGMASNDGETSISGDTFVNQRHPMVTAGVLDGALRRHLGRSTVEVRYDRTMYLTMDSLLALEERAAGRWTWTSDPLALETSLFAARTRLWRDRAPAGETHWTDGVALRGSTDRAGFAWGLAIEVGRSFYADAEVDALAPSLGWRTTLDVTRRWGRVAVKGAECSREHACQPHSGGGVTLDPW